jgi:cellulose synthase/poly-beta-1,6-N-acetylglucosamine synthase-like glycosyltransferase
MEFTGITAISLISYAIGALAIIFAIPAVSLLVLTFAATRRATAALAMVADRAPVRVAVLVPAHNESVHLLPTLQCLQSQLGVNDRLIVIADNCSDDTAEVARHGGAEVLERHSEKLRGKGYALAFGVDALRDVAPDVVVVVDADCIVSADGIHAIAQRCVQTQCPVQMLDLMVAPEGSGLRARMLEFAWIVKNQVRPTGSFRLGQACHLMGTGMALPWELAATARLATGHIAEDMKLGVELAIAGRPTQFVDYVRVTSAFPLDADAALGQKTRWEHGHLQTLTQELPRLMGAFVRKPRAATLVLALDLLIPPLALYFSCLAVSLLLLSIGHLSGLDLGIATWVSLMSAAVFALAIGLSWMRYGRHLLSLRELLTAPVYAAWKLPVYVAYFLKRKSGWLRTPRQV